MIDPLLLAVTRVTTLKDEQHLTNASGFFYSCGEQLFLVSSRHVFRDDTRAHFPDRILKATSESLTHREVNRIAVFGARVVEANIDTLGWQHQETQTAAVTRNRLVITHAGE